MERSTSVRLALAVPLAEGTLTGVLLLQALSKALEGLTSMHVWLRLPLADDEATNIAVWRWWHTVRTLCKYSPLLGICLDVEGDDANLWLERRWVAEPLRCLVQPIAAFVRNRKGFPVLPEARKRLVSSVLSMGAQV
jgi:type II protein arginine methyltransferase